ncbi:unnamed protein product, partial [Iphiclides podalirius]
MGLSLILMQHDETDTCNVSRGSGLHSGRVSPSAVVLRSGSTFRRNGTILAIEEVIPNPDYNSETFDMDIAVMKTTQTIVFNDCTQPVPLPPKGESPKTGQIMTVSGWGYTKKGSYTLPDKLMAVNLKIVSRKLCEAVYPTMTSNMLCAGSLKGGQSACQGDSGGVGVIDDIARGVVSFGRVCGQALAPSAFTDLSAPPIREFITEITGL